MTKALKGFEAVQSKQRKKIDTSVNGDAKRLVEENNRRNVKLYPLRIDKNTVILVPKEKCTPEYAEYKRCLYMKNVGIGMLKGGGSRMSNNKKEELLKCIKDGMSVQDVCGELGISEPTVRKYKKEIDNENKN